MDLILFWGPSAGKGRWHLRPCNMSGFSRGHMAGLYISIRADKKQISAWCNSQSIVKRRCKKPGGCLDVPNWALCSWNWQQAIQNIIRIIRIKIWSRPKTPILKMISKTGVASRTQPILTNIFWLIYLLVIWAVHSLKQLTEHLLQGQQHIFYRTK